MRANREKARPVRRREVCAAQFETDINIKMSLYSLDFFNNCGFDCGYEPRGYLFFATDEQQFDYLKANVLKQHELGVKDVDIVDTDTVSRIVPGMNCDDITGGSFGARDGFINPLAVMDGFTTKALENGARIEFDTQVLSIETAGGRITGAETSKGRIECEKGCIMYGCLGQAFSWNGGNRFAGPGDEAADRLGQKPRRFAGEFAYGDRYWERVSFSAGTGVCEGK